MSDLANQRDDFERRLAARDQTISRLRERIEEIESGVRRVLTLWDSDTERGAALARSELMGLVRKIDRKDLPDAASGG